MVIPTLTNTQKIVGPPQGQWTYADWEQLPDVGNRSEVIDGILYFSELPSIFHQWIVGQLLECLALNSKLQGYGIHNVGVILSCQTVVVPDFTFVKTKNAAIMVDKRIRGVPDLIAEVLSPGNKDYNEDVKLTAYAKAGVPEYVVIDAWKKQLRLYSQPMNGEYGALKKFNVDDRVTFAGVPDITLVVGDLFTGSPDETL
ncbi:MAG: Uma2 family endonuclease [Anaerolineae bacterium]|nr:Uma2 family endonuclease [Anaerolineae bacterium]